jgi:hypothetical protein
MSQRRELDPEDPKQILRQRLIDVLEADRLFTLTPLPETEPPASGRFADDEIEIPKDLRIEADCPSPKCRNARRTFAFVPASDRNGEHDQRIDVDTSSRLAFRCTHCQSQTLSFLLHVERTKKAEGLSIVKAGQWPSARPKPHPDVASGLGDSLDMFTKGMIAERFAFGVGSLAYYRLVTEDIISRLMDDLRTFAVNLGQADLVRAIDETKEEQQASKRIEAVKELVLPYLRPNGLNPLGILFGRLSEGLHPGRSDEECLQLAGELGAALAFLVATLAAHTKSAEQFISAMQKLREDREKKAKPTDGK